MSFNDLIQVFHYDHNLDLDKDDVSVKHRDNISVHDITYLNVSNVKISAYLVEPSGKGPFAGIIFVHPGPGSRESFLEEAVELAGKGVVSLLISAPWAYPDFTYKISELFQAGLPEWYIQITKDILRGIDLLVSQPNVDQERLGYVGHSFGALFGGILVGIDDKIKSYVLMAGTGSFVDVTMANIPDLSGDMLKEHRKMMKPINPIHYIGHASQSSIFFQFGIEDEIFSRQNSLDYYNKASKPKKIKWYKAGHYLNEEASKDRVEWFSNKFGLNHD